MRNVVVVCVVCAAVSLSASQGQLGKAVADRDRVDALRHYRLGQDAFRNEHLDVAEREFQAAAKLDPTLELAPYGLGQVYMALKQYRPAIAAYDKCRDVIRANAVVVAGDEMVYQRRIEEQIKALEDEERLYSQPGKNGNTPAAQANIRTIEMRIRAMKDAKRRTTGGAAEPTPAWLSLALGSAYFRTDALPDAEREYRAAIEVDPKLGEAHNNLAVVYMTTGRYLEADAEIKAAEKAGFRVNPQLKEDVKKASARR
jgi:tetratricopeptide (TPR) repeat protein